MTMISYREIFFGTNGLGPWTCFGCDELVQLSELRVHHIDENHNNDDPENLTAMHSLCHQRLHKIGKSPSAETRRKIGDGNRGKVVSAEARTKLSDALRGKPKSDEHRAALSRSLRGKPMPPMTNEHKQKISDAQRARWAQRKKEKAS